MEKCKKCHINEQNIAKMCKECYGKETKRNRAYISQRFRL